MSDRAPDERRRFDRPRLGLTADVLYGLLRAIGRHAQSFYAALGAYLIIGATVAGVAVWGFAEFAKHVKEGRTLDFDLAAMEWMSAHRIDLLDMFLLDVTALGTGLVVLVIVGVAALFLALTEHRYSAILLLVATAGGQLLSTVLKMFYDRPRPSVIEPLTHTASTSFPSGHAMSAVVVYGTVAYLAARLQKKRWQRWLTMLSAALIIVSIAASRVYLGVHYPSDVLAGTIGGAAWAAFCMSGLEAVRVFAARFRPSELEHERDLDKGERAAAGLST
ncbi:MAG TPA: phosphatase PAP2 family protein [Gemmatimonadaceae bacterium]|nr:phosphatase PAP2 family protein [Gemmatimonadaceae bacterium]